MHLECHRFVLCTEKRDVIITFSESLHKTHTPTHTPTQCIVIMLLF